MRVSADLIRQQGQQLQGYGHGMKRAAQLAAEIQTLLSVVSDAAGGLSFEDEPSHFRVVQQRAKAPR